MANTENLDNAIERYDQLLKSYKTTRKLWQTDKMKLISRTLMGISGLYDVGLSPWETDYIINHESVGMAFDDVPTDFEYKADDFENIAKGRSGKLIKKGAQLCFSFTGTDYVFFWMVYPKIVELIEHNPSSKDLGLLEMNEVTEQAVCDYAVLFIEEVIRWERSREVLRHGEEMEIQNFAERRLIGFQKSEGAD